MSPKSEVAVEAVARKQGCSEAVEMLGSGCDAWILLQFSEVKTVGMKCSEAQCVRWIRTGLDWHHRDDRQCASLRNERSAG